MMKVLMVCGTYTDGDLNTSSQFVHSQAKAMRKIGVDTSVLSIDLRSFRRKRKLGIYKTVIDNIKVYVVSLPCGPIPFLHEALTKFGAQCAFRKYMKENGKNNIFHCHFQHANSISNIAKRHNIPIVTTEHATWVLDENRTRKGEKKAIQAYNDSKRVIAVSRTLKSSIKNFYRGNVTIIPNILSENFGDGEFTKNKEFTFVSVGYLRKHKNHELTIRAFERFCKINPNSRLKVIGVGELDKHLKECVKELGISDYVEFLGFVENNKLGEIMSQSHCFCLPSEYETFGVVYIEALACGLPVIANSTTLENEIVNDHNGIALFEYTVDSVYDSMIRIYNEYDKFDKLDISRETINKYSESIVSSEIIKVYEEIDDEKNRLCNNLG